MKLANMYQCLHLFPGIYYYSTRYSSLCRRIFHVFKYWMLYLLAAWCVSPDMWSHPAAFFMCWLGFLNIYDWFCYKNDVDVTGWESRPTLRALKSCPPRSIFWKIKWGWQIVLLLMLLVVSPDARYLGRVIAVYLGLCVVFETHNHLHESMRPITIYLLYLLKSVCCWVGFYPLLTGSAGVKFAIFSLLLNATYIPQYAVKKLGIAWKGSAEKILRFTFVPFVLKNAVMLGLVIWRPIFLAVWIWMVAMTLLEYFCAAPDRR
ncbi:MAG: hypothetical protein V2A34_09020 [Lentisphaerota bacterium]